MSEATTQTTNTLSIAAVPSAPTEAHQRADLGTENLKKLPALCYGLIARNDPGKRIVIIRAGERGYYQTDFDSASLSLASAQVLVDRLNVRLGVTDAQQLAMAAGFAFGFNIPAADPEHPVNACARVGGCRDPHLGR